MRCITTAAVFFLATPLVGFAQSIAGEQVSSKSPDQMSVWSCLTFIAIAGAIGGLVNTLMTDGRFRLPKYEAGILCPGFLGNVCIGAFAAAISWALYGAGAGIEVARLGATERQVVSLTVGALAGAGLIGVGGARWLSQEVDSKLLRASLNVTAEKTMTPEQRSAIAAAPAIDVFRSVQGAASSTA
jgi:hypothetical protein